uniref:Serine/threonine-protein kinase 11-interacting protein n=1 Tax=Esox lucius TaxID=8010 RepID=A0A3P9AKU2_ESOLU
MAVCQSGQSTLVNSLASLLRNEGASVLDGSSTLTLQADSLQHLGRLFEQYLLNRTHQHGFLALPSHPADTPSLLQLQFLFDVLQKTVSLKLINPPGVRLQSVVKIFPFKSLKSLELKRIPPHCLEGLRGVYSQLEVFTCSKSLSSLEELLSLCGGDLSSALPWLDLHTLNFSYNHIVRLDESLSLLNVLKCLDLSHNKIPECAEFLKPLSELQRLNLGYNNLQRVPMLSPSCRAKLLTLVLRNNELESVDGVDQLFSLQHLDLAYNLLLEHSQLAPLSMLHNLKVLNLEGNPLFFQKTHRTSTVRHLSPKAAYVGVSDKKRKQESYICFLSSMNSCLEVNAVSIPSSDWTAALSPPQSLSKETAPLPSDIVLPHKKEIERMDSFREQMGDEWLRFQHHLDGAAIVHAAFDAHEKAAPRHLVNGLLVPPSPSNPGTIQTIPSKPSQDTSGLPEVLPAPLLSSEPREVSSDGDSDLETESTLQWLMSTVKFGDLVEFQSLLVVSDQRIYFLEVTSDMQGQPCDWLRKRDSHPITELCYLEVGLGSQSIHMEFEDGPVAYTLLVRDSARCKLVRELSTKSDSKLKSISTTRLNPQHHLCCFSMGLLGRCAKNKDKHSTSQAILIDTSYFRRTKCVFSMSCISFVSLLEDSVTPLTVLATRETLYLLNEDHQWSKSLPNPSANENAEPCSGHFTVQETQPISCLSSVHLWSSDPCRMDLKLYDEIAKEEKTWSLQSDGAELIQGLLVWVRTQWENMFGVKLTTSTTQGPRP